MAIRSGFAIVLFVLAGCTRSTDVYVANPCSMGLTATFWSVPSTQTDSHQPTKAASLDPVSITLVPAAFTDALGKQWSVEIDANEFVEVDGAALENSTIVLPARVC